MTTREILLTARGRIANRRTRWSFIDVTACTSGHIYAAATGRKAHGNVDSDDMIQHPVFAKAIFETALALGHAPTDVDNAFWHVSNVTADAAGANRQGMSAETAEREHGIAIIDRALEALAA